MSKENNTPNIKNFSEDILEYLVNGFLFPEIFGEDSKYKNPLRKTITQNGEDWAPDDYIRNFIILNDRYDSEKRHFPKTLREARNRLLYAIKEGLIPKSELNAMIDDYANYFGLENIDYDKSFNFKDLDYLPISADQMTPEDIAKYTTTLANYLGYKDDEKKGSAREQFLEDTYGYKGSNPFAMFGRFLADSHGGFDGYDEDSEENEKLKELFKGKLSDEMLTDEEKLARKKFLRELGYTTEGAVDIESVINNIPLFASRDYDINSRDNVIRLFEDFFFPQLSGALNNGQQPTPLDYLTDGTLFAGNVGLNLLFPGSGVVAKGLSSTIAKQGLKKALPLIGKELVNKEFAKETMNRAFANSIAQQGLDYGHDVFKQHNESPIYDLVQSYGKEAHNKKAFEDNLKLDDRFWDTIQNAMLGAGVGYGGRFFSMLRRSPAKKKVSTPKEENADLYHDNKFYKYKGMNDEKKVGEAIDKATELAGIQEHSLEESISHLPQKLQKEKSSEVSNLERAIEQVQSTIQSVLKDSDPNFTKPQRIDAFLRNGRRDRTGEVNNEFFNWLKTKGMLEEVASLPQEKQKIAIKELLTLFKKGITTHAVQNFKYTPENKRTGLNKLLGGRH